MVDVQDRSYQNHRGTFAGGNDMVKLGRDVLLEALQVISDLTTDAGCDRMLNIRQRADEAVTSLLLVADATAGNPQQPDR